jgi:hypothetical protein
MNNSKIFTKSNTWLASHWMTRTAKGFVLPKEKGGAALE